MMAKKKHVNDAIEIFKKKVAEALKGDNAAEDIKKAVADLLEDMEIETK